MRKQELIHLHRLTVELRRYLRERSDLAVGTAPVDDGAAVGPMAVHRRKAAHQAAVRRALTGIVGAIESPPSTGEPRLEAPPDQD